MMFVFFIKWNDVGGFVLYDFILFLRYGCDCLIDCVVVGGVSNFMGG